MLCWFKLHRELFHSSIQYYLFIIQRRDHLNKSDQREVSEQKTSTIFVLLISVLHNLIGLFIYTTKC